MRKSNLNRYYNNENDKNILLLNLVIKIVNKLIKDFYPILDKFVFERFSSMNEIQSHFENLYIPKNKINLELKRKYILNTITIMKLAADESVVVFETDMEGCPAKFSLAFPRERSLDAPDWQHAWGVSGGRGLTSENSFIGALGEAAECMSVWSRGQTDPLVVHPSSASVKDDIPAPGHFLNLSDQQIDLLQARNVLFDPSGFTGTSSSHKLQNFDFSNRITQFQDKNTNACHFIPSFCSLVGEEKSFGIPSERLVSTNGSAVAETFAVASDKAMFELIERDAVAIWWYNRIARQKLPRSVIEEACGSDLHMWLYSRVRHFHVLDLRSDLGIPVAGALSYEQDGSMIADGYAAGRTWPEAVLSAVLEMLQAEISLSFMEQKAERDLMAGEADEPTGFLAETKAMNLFADRFMSGHAESGAIRNYDIEVSVDDALDILTGNNIQVLVADVTREEIGIPAARAISPQLRDWQPRFGPGRLYSVPVKMGWLEEENTEETLNPRAFLN